jgi:hypothetical protein
LQDDFQKLFSLENNFVWERFASANSAVQIPTENCFLNRSRLGCQQKKISCACGDDGGGGGCCDARGGRAQKQDYDAPQQGWQRATRRHARMQRATKKIRNKLRQQLAARILQNIS